MSTKLTQVGAPGTMHPVLYQIVQEAKDTGLDKSSFPNEVLPNFAKIDALRINIGTRGSLQVPRLSYLTK